MVITLAGGRVQVDGWNTLSPEERERLRDEKERIVARLVARELRRQRREERRRNEQEAKAAAQQQQRQRRVIGHHVVPGYPQLSRLLYEDETRPIPPRGRVLATIPYGWRR